MRDIILTQKQADEIIKLVETFDYLTLNAGWSLSKDTVRALKGFMPDGVNVRKIEISEYPAPK